MKKTGLIAGISFLAGALFFALFFGYLQKSDSDKPLLSPSVAQAEPLVVNRGGLNFAPLVKKVRPAVVKVISLSIRKRGFGFGDDLLDRFFNFTPRKERVPGVGSGFFISNDGYIITNNHVVENAIKVRIKTIDDKEYIARIIGTDPKTDLALLKIDAENVPFIRLGDSNKVEVGEWVLAIGNPLEQDLSVTAGIISAKGRQLGMAEYEDFLQTDAAINRGNSGGPLINMEGKVIGINSVILAPGGGNIGIGFAIPSNLAEKVVGDLKTKGRVIRGYLGIRIQALSESEAKDFDLTTAGILVIKVEEDSPAEKAGLKKYDLIV
ncbi:MAG: trypsin-like peptidase domain-containing protein, partial [Candidatus Aminicenantes bacterium]